MKKEASRSVEFKPLNSVKGIFDVDSLEDRLDGTAETVIGITRFKFLLDLLIY